MIEINVDKKTVSVQSTQPLYAGCVDTYSCHFTFDRTWDGFSKSAVFRVNGRAITTLIDDEGGCLLPWELLTRANLGYTIEIGMYGVSAESEVITSVWDELGAVRDGTELGSDAKEPYPGVYAQIMAGVKRIDGKVENYNLEAKSLLQRAETTAASVIGCAENTAISKYQATVAARLASDALAGVQNAIQNIPSGSTPIVNDLTTGGETSALSAEMGKELSEQIKGYTFTSLSEIGLKDSDFLITKTDDTQETMPFKDVVVMILTGLSTVASGTVVFNPSMTQNLASALRAKLNADLGMEIASATPRMRLTRFGGANVPAKIEVVIDSNAYTQIFTALVDTTSSGSAWLYPFIVTYDSAGFLRQSGGKISGDLEIGGKTTVEDELKVKTNATNAIMTLENSSGNQCRVAQTADYAVLQARKTSASAARQFRINPYNPESAKDTPLKNMVRVYSGEPKGGTFDLYGSHNKLTGTYKGTGAAQGDTDVGSVGSALVIWNNTFDICSIVTLGGAICKQGTTVSALSATEISYTDGVLTINTTSELVNKIGRTYSYRAL